MSQTLLSQPKCQRLSTWPTSVALLGALPMYPAWCPSRHGRPPSAILIDACSGRPPPRALCRWTILDTALWTRKFARRCAPTFYFRSKKTQKTRDPACVPPSCASREPVWRAGRLDLPISELIPPFAAHDHPPAAACVQFERFGKLGDVYIPKVRRPGPGWCRRGFRVYWR